MIPELLTGVWLLTGGLDLDGTAVGVGFARGSLWNELSYAAQSNRILRFENPFDSRGAVWTRNLFIAGGMERWCLAGRSLICQELTAAPVTMDWGLGANLKVWHYNRVAMEHPGATDVTLGPSVFVMLWATRYRGSGLRLMVDGVVPMGSFRTRAIQAELSFVVNLTNSIESTTTEEPDDSGRRFRD